MSKNMKYRLKNDKFKSIIVSQFTHTYNIKKKRFTSFACDDGFCFV